MPRICIYLSEETMQKLETLTAENSGKPSKTIEVLIEKAFQNSHDKNSKGEGTNANEYLKKLRQIENDTNKRVQVLEEIMNSFIASFGTFTAEDFQPSSEHPHPWMSFAEREVTNRIERLQQEKFMRGGK